MFTVGGAKFTVGEAVFSRRRIFIVGGAPKQGRRTPLNGTGDDFYGGHSCFLSVSNDCSERKGPKIGQSVSQCPFKHFFS